ncbi:MAG: metallophosphoesterase [Anaerolineaceae bacterium]|nr:metallophosphoesterase [Anaerolineaceae bacterium]
MIVRLGLAIVVILSMGWITQATTAQAASSSGSNCATNSVEIGSYTATNCITSPKDGDSLSGDVTVTSSFTITNPKIKPRSVIFYLNGQYVLTTFQKPYSFTLPTTYFPDGFYTLTSQATMTDGYVMTNQPSISLTINNGISVVPAAATTFKPALGIKPAAGSPFVVVAVGDGTSGELNEDKVTQLITNQAPNLLLYLGDDYEKGTATEFFNYYGTGNQLYSAFKSITDPTPGNHDYLIPNASGYFDYWNNPPSYYSFTTGGWHFVSINSNFYKVDTTAGSDQYNWVVQDLAKNRSLCTIVFYHHPLFNIGPEGSTTQMADLWSVFAQDRVAVVLNGHDHDYQHWTAMNGAGQPDPTGVPEFVVGTGGHGIQTVKTSDSRVVYNGDKSPTDFGVLRLDLSAKEAKFQFINITNTVLDSGTIPCNASLPDGAKLTIPASQLDKMPTPNPNADNPTPVSPNSSVPGSKGGTGSTGPTGGAGSTSNSSGSGSNPGAASNSAGKGQANSGGPTEANESSKSGPKANIPTYQVLISVRDALLNTNIGKGIILTYPDGHTQFYPVDANGEVTISSLPRGNYGVKVVGALTVFPESIVGVGQGEQISLNVPSVVDFVLAFLVVLLLAAVLLFIGRPDLLGKRKHTPRSPGSPKMNQAAKS